MPKKPTQLELQRRIQDKLGLNIVTCCSCPSVLIIKVTDLTVKCPDCGAESDACNFPDLNY